MQSYVLTLRVESHKVKPCLQMLDKGTDTNGWAYNTENINGYHKSFIAYAPRGLGFHVRQKIWVVTKTKT